jgi:hypothetical protein
MTLIKVTDILEVPITSCRPRESAQSQTDRAARGRLMPMQVLPGQVVHHAGGQACAKAKGSALQWARMLAVKSAAAFIGTPQG